MKPTDPGNEEWKQMQELWAQSHPGRPAVDEVLSYVAGRTQEFDRKIIWRNRREWFGGLAGIVGLYIYMNMVETAVEFVFGISMGVLVIGVCVHMWRSGRAGAPVDPSLSRTQFRESMQEKFERQIRLLRAVKIWFLIPLTATGAVTAWVYRTGEIAPKDWFYFPLILTGAIIAWFANEWAGEKSVRDDWEKVRRALDDGELTRDDGPEA